MSPSHGHSTLCVLVGAGTFDAQHPFPDLRGGKAEHNLDAMARVLTSRQQPHFPVRVVRVLDPATPQQIRSVLERPNDEEPPGLLVFYYVGHGYRDPDDNDRLYLAVRRSDARKISTTALAVEELIHLVDEYGADESVVVLDCCYSGDALSHKSTDLSRPFGTLTSSLAGRVISPGPDTEPLTPFTRTLVRTLHLGPRKLNRLGVDLRRLSERAENQPPGGYPWFAAEVSRSGGADIVLPPGPPPARVVGADGREEDAQPGGAPQGGQPSGGGRQQGDGATTTTSWSCRLRRLSAVLAAVLALSLAGLLAWAVVRDVTGSCPPPLELRMATAPEETTGMRQLVRAFENSAANHRDVEGAERCRRARFTVYGASLDALTRAFGESGAWGSGQALTEVGPQPDVWVAQSSAAVAQLRVGLVPPEGAAGDFLSDEALMTDDPVLVLTEQARQRLGLPPADGPPGSVDWLGLRSSLLALDEDERPVLFRPNPTVSGVGLAHTIGMYGRRGNGTFAGELLPEDASHRLETQLIGKGRSLAGSEQALCALRDGDAAGALVSRRQTRLYAGRPGYCPGDGHALRIHRYVLTGGPSLDYRLVHVAWPAADRQRRADAVAGFAAWARTAEGAQRLREASYAPAGEAVTPVSGRDVTGVLDRFHRAHPELRLTVLFDISGSMRENGRFTAAERAVEESLGRLAESDRYRVSLYPARTDGSGLRPHVPEWTAVPGDGGAGLGLGTSALHDEDDRYADLLGALRQAAERIPGHDTETRHAVLLVTDGDYVAGEEPRVERLGQLAADLGARDVPVIVASMRPYGCAADRDTSVIAFRSGGQCEPLSDVASELPRHVAALTEGRPE